MMKYIQIIFIFSLYFFKWNCLPLEAQNQSATDSLRNVINNTKDSSAKMSALIQLSFKLNTTDAAQARQYAHHALNLALQSGENKVLIKIYLNLSLLYYYQSDLKNAIEYALEAKNLAEKSNSENELAVALSDLGRAYYDLGEKKKCSEYYFSSLKIFENLKDKVGQSKALTSIGILFYDQNDFDKAIEYNSKALTIDKEINDQEGIAANLNNLANVMFGKKDFINALKYFKEAYQISEKQNNIPYKASFSLNIGKTYLKLKEYDQALTYCSEALKIFESTGNNYSIAIARIRIGEINLEMKKYDQALDQAHKALTLSQQNSLREIIYQSSKLLHHIYIAKNDTSSAFRYIYLENQYKDTLALSEREKTLASLELQYHFEKKEQEELVMRQKRTLFAAVIFAIMALVIIIILLILNQLRLKTKKSKLEKEGLEKELEFKKKEITLNVMSLMKKNEMLSEISDKIVQIKDEAIHPETRDALQRVGKEILKSSDDDTLKEFSLRFKEVHKEFYDALLHRFPDLTPGELKLCAFLKLNMTTKEICELTGQRLNSLETARYRLRLKLGISNSEVNLVSFLSQF
jgi:tetratricopeptide (TPR) repeat protein